MDDEEPVNPAKEYRLDEQVGHLLRRANQRHGVLFSERFADSGLTALQFAVVMKLAEVGETSQNRLGRLTAMDPNTIQGVVTRLVGRGLVERRQHPADRRRVNLALTADGTALAQALVQDGIRISGETLAPLNSRESETFLALLRKLI